MTKKIKTTITFVGTLEDGDSVNDFIYDTRSWLLFTQAPFAETAEINAKIINDDDENDCLMPSTASSAAAI